MTRKTHARRDRGMALIVALSVVVLLAAVVATAVGWAKNDRLHAGKIIHNMTVQDVTESTLQYGRAFFAQPPTYAKWNTYLAYFVTTKTFTQIQTDHPELIPSLPAGAGFDCFTYARDDVDELPPAAVNTSTDNNLRILVGAVCKQQGGTLQSELVGLLEYNPAASSNCSSQFSSGTQGNNNCSGTVAYR
jgi:hypothetical protein